MYDNSEIKSFAFFVNSWHSTLSYKISPLRCHYYIYLNGLNKCDKTHCFMFGAYHCWSKICNFRILCILLCCSGNLFPCRIFVCKHIL